MSKMIPSDPATKVSVFVFHLLIKELIGKTGFSASPKGSFAGAPAWP